MKMKWTDGIKRRFNGIRGKLAGAGGHREPKELGLIAELLKQAYAAKGVEEKNVLIARAQRMLEGMDITPDDFHKEYSKKQ
jgi:hypothetical protein